MLSRGERPDDVVVHDLTGRVTLTLRWCGIPSETVDAKSCVYVVGDLVLDLGWTTTRYRDSGFTWEGERVKLKERCSVSKPSLSFPLEELQSFGRQSHKTSALFKLVKGHLIADLVPLVLRYAWIDREKVRIFRPTPLAVSPVRAPLGQSVAHWSDLGTDTRGRTVDGMSFDGRHLFGSNFCLFTGLGNSAMPIFCTQDYCGALQLKRARCNIHLFGIVRSEHHRHLVKLSFAQVPRNVRYGIHYAYNEAMHALEYLIVADGTLKAQRVSGMSIQEIPLHQYQGLAAWSVDSKWGFQHSLSTKLVWTQQVKKMTLFKEQAWLCENNNIMHVFDFTAESTPKSVLDHSR